MLFDLTIYFCTVVTSWKVIEWKKKASSFGAFERPSKEAYAIVMLEKHHKCMKTNERKI